MRGRRDRPPRS
ncbi:Protein of unknown function [Gryllus bimaculatus]|nr:Protein of unknown function [Gryllus bimaculatus]